MKISQEKFNSVKVKAEEFYKKISKVYCPYFQENVSFNAKGLNHIKFKNWNRTRLIEDQYLRLKFLHLAVEVIKKSHTLQEFREAKGFERQKINSRWERRLVEIKYYAFVAILNNVRIKVIIKEAGGGNKFFWSICPFWRQKKDRNGKNKKILYDGDLENQ